MATGRRPVIRLVFPLWQFESGSSLSRSSPLVLVFQFFPVLEVVYICEVRS
uniref:Uncharacterized protein n=1 Tax=Setaria viridis TaxID=4556 RepID=A0A4U6TLA7_SETVI|nr:hypothetical protein SEVIR_8G215901v2 [Setaria viridis]